ncbi:MAG: TolC family protein [Ginsengibacter sp.]|jgi:outer membrane protein TolC
MRLFNKKYWLISFMGMFFTHSAFSQTDLLTVQEAIKYAIENNYGILMTKNDIEIGGINNNWANAGAIPVISATANKAVGLSNLDQKLNNGTVTQKKGSTTQNLNAGVAVNWRVFDGFKMFATKQKLEELEKRGEYVFRKNLNETVYNVVTSYYRIVTLNEQSEASEEQISLYRDRFNLAQRKYEIGTGAKFEVLEAEVDLNAQRSNLLSLQNEIALAKSSLNNLMGRIPQISFKVIDTIIVQSLPSIAEVNSKIELQNPDVMLANSDLAILMQEKREINAKRLPTVNINGFYNFAKSRNSAGFTLFNQSYGPSGSIGVSVPIFNGGLVKKQLQIADIDIRNQELFINETKNDIATSLNNVYINYNNSLKAIELEKENLILATENIKIAMERYRVLNITSVELRQIQISYNAVKNRLYNALLQGKISEAGVALLMGEIENL